MSNNYAPIALFTYKRLWHTQQTIASLQANTLAKESILYIYSDGARGAQDSQEVDAVRQYLDVVKQSNIFKEVHIIVQPYNKGLKKNIVEGVTNIVQEHGTVIVLEDDHVTSPYFLTFMNQALDYYEHTKEVFHISGWNYPVDMKNTRDIFLHRLMNCWGWATWKNRWEHYRIDCKEWHRVLSAHEKHEFDLGMPNHLFSNMLEDDFVQTISTWDVCWYTTIFIRHGLCVNPVESLVKNIGMDGSGEHCGHASEYARQTISQKKSWVFEDVLEPNETAREKIYAFFHHPYRIKDDLDHARGIEGKSGLKRILWKLFPPYRIYRRFLAAQDETEALVRDLSVQQHILFHEVLSLNLYKRFYDKQVVLYNALNISLSELPIDNWRTIPMKLLENIVNIVQQGTYSTIVEVGGYIVPLVIAHALKKQGQGRIISVQYTEWEADKMRQYIETHALNDVIEVRYSPVKSRPFLHPDGTERTWLWYDTDCLNDVSVIDMLLLDKMPRYGYDDDILYPALSGVSAYLSDNADVIIWEEYHIDHVVSLWNKNLAPTRETLVAVNTVHDTMFSYQYRKKVLQ